MVTVESKPVPLTALGLAAIAIACAIPGMRVKLDGVAVSPADVVTVA